VPVALSDRREEQWRIEVTDLPAKSLGRNGGLVFFFALVVEPEFLIRQASEAPRPQIPEHCVGVGAVAA
jgi:hypothetical protein